jgi:hypothetical protein
MLIFTICCPEPVHGKMLENLVCDNVSLHTACKIFIHLRSLLIHLQTALLSHIVGMEIFFISSAVLTVNETEKNKLSDDTQTKIFVLIFRCHDIDFLVFLASAT